MLSLVLALSLQQPDPVLAKIRDEGLNHSRAWSMVDTLATVIGPRLTASPAFMRAATWARDHLSSWGLSDVHMEIVAVRPRVGAGEVHARDDVASLRADDRVSRRVVRRRPRGGEIVGTPILIAGLSSDSLEKMRGALKGAIVLDAAHDDDLHP